MRARSTRGSDELPARRRHRVLRAQRARRVRDAAHHHRAGRGRDGRRSSCCSPSAGIQPRSTITAVPSASTQRREHVVAVLAVVHLVAQQHLVRGRRSGPVACTRSPGATARRRETSGAGAAYAARASRTSCCLWWLRASCQKPRAMKLAVSTSTSRWPATQRGRKSVTTPPSLSRRTMMSRVGGTSWP